MKIGIFDSGIGGLTALKKLKAYQGLELFYFADFKHLPYGDKSSEQICQFADQIVQFFISKNIKHIVIGCNTATVAALLFLQAKYPHLIFIEAIDVTIIEAMLISRNKKIALMATPFVVQSNYYSLKAKLFNERYFVFEIACSGLASLIESEDDSLIDIALAKYIALICQYGADTLILGCTHYGYLYSKIKQLDSNLQVITSDNHVKNLIPYIEKEGHARKHIPSSVSYFASSKKSIAYDSSKGVPFELVDL